MAGARREARLRLGRPGLWRVCARRASAVIHVRVLRRCAVLGLRDAQGKGQCVVQSRALLPVRGHRSGCGGRTVDPRVRVYASFHQGSGYIRGNGPRFPLARSPANPLARSAKPMVAAVCRSPAAAPGLCRRLLDQRPSRPVLGSTGCGCPAAVPGREYFSVQPVLPVRPRVWHLPFAGEVGLRLQLCRRHTGGIWRRTGVWLLAWTCAGAAEILQPGSGCTGGGRPGPGVRLPLRLAAGWSCGGQPLRPHVEPGGSADHPDRVRRRLHLRSPEGLAGFACADDDHRAGGGLRSVYGQLAEQLPVHQSARGVRPARPAGGRSGGPGSRACLQRVAVARQLRDGLRGGGHRRGQPLAVEVVRGAGQGGA